MGSALQKQLRQFLWRNPIAHFYLRGWIGVHKEGIPPGFEFLLRLLLCLKETDFTPVPLLVVCPDLPALIHPYDDLHRLSPCTHIPAPLLAASPCLLPSAKVIAYLWGDLVLGSCHPRGLAHCFSLFTGLFSFSVFCGFFFSCCVTTQVAQFITLCRASKLSAARDVSSPVQGSSPAKTWASLRPSRAHGHHLRPSTNCEKLSGEHYQAVSIPAWQAERRRDAPLSSPP